MFKKSSSVETVRNVLRRYNFHGQTARKKPFINEVNRKDRLEFAKTYINQPQEFWNSVLFQIHFSIKSVYYGKSV